MSKQGEKVTIKINKNHKNSQHPKKHQEKAHKPAVAAPRHAKATRVTPKEQGSGLFHSLGGVVSSAASGIVGKAADWMGKITGLGDYKVNVNSLVTGPPSFGTNDTVITHREYISDIFSGPVSSGAGTQFNSVSFNINPGLIASFPWLGQIGAYWEQYELKGLIFEYKTTSGNALTSTNTALGTVIMATQYDVNDPLFTDKKSMEAYEFCTSCAPSCSMVHPVECAPKENTLNVLYTRYLPVSSGSDGRFTDIGRLQVATVGMQGTNVNLGELWVSYHLALMKPKLLSLGLPAASYLHLQGVSAGTGAPLGNTQVVVSNINLSYTSSATSIIINTPGRYFCYLSLYNPALHSFASLTPFFSTSPNIVLLPGAFINGTVNQFNACNDQPGSPPPGFASAACIITVSGLGGILTLPTWSTSSSGESSDFFLIQIDISASITSPLSLEERIAELERRVTRRLVICSEEEDQKV